MKNIKKKGRVQSEQFIFTLLAIVHTLTSIAAFLIILLRSEGKQVSNTKRQNQRNANCFDVSSEGCSE